MSQAKRLFEAIDKFPVLPHNLLSTATDDDRRQAIEVILRWWNGDIIPILTEIKRGRDEIAAPVTQSH